MNRNLIIKSNHKSLFYMAPKNKEQQERVRRSSSDQANQVIDQQTAENIRRFGYADSSVVAQRLLQLNREWDIEKTLEVNAATLALAGLVLGTWVNKRWYVLPGVVTGFLLQHGLQGWCPPLPLFRKWGIRTKDEINQERMALKALRGDFKEITPASTPATVLSKIWYK